jgi:nitrogen regulatory protein P-II
MRILLITFRDSLEQEVYHLLREEGIKAYTVIPSVHGVGEAGPAFGTLTSNGKNSMILLALPKDRAGQLVKAFTDVRDHLAELQHGAKIPMRLFVLPCEQMI